MKTPDFETIAKKYVCVIRDESLDIKTWQVCLKQDWSSDQPDVGWYHNKGNAEDLAKALKRSIKTAMRDGWNAAIKTTRGDLEAAIKNVMQVLEETGD